MTNLQELTWKSDTEKFAALCHMNLQAYKAKFTDMEDRARQDNLLIFDLVLRARIYSLTWLRIS